MNETGMLVEENDDAGARGWTDDALRFDDPEWDDEFCTWLDNGLRSCCG